MKEKITKKRINKNLTTRKTRLNVKKKCWKKTYLKRKNEKGKP